MKTCNGNLWLQERHRRFWMQITVMVNERENTMDSAMAVQRRARGDNGKYVCCRNVTDVRGIY